MTPTTRRLATAVLGLIVFAGLIAADELILRRLFGTHYVRWYLANGFVISLVFAFVSLAWGDLNSQPGLISAHPVEYAAAHVGLCVLPSEALAAIFAPRAGAGDGGSSGAPIGLGFLDMLLSLLVTLALLAGLVIWLLVVVPVQCFVYLVAAAPAREAYASPERAWFGVTRRNVTVESGPRSADLPAGAVESGYSTQPVTFTATVAAALLFAVQRVIP